jgi:hypothetical protein
MKDFHYMKLLMVLSALILLDLSITNLLKACQADIADTITLNEVRLKSSSDTVYVTVGDTIYKIPVKLPSNASSNIQKGRQYFRFEGLRLSQNNLEYHLKELFKNPREKLKDPISAIDWKNSDVYRRYFEQYDENSEFLGKAKEIRDSIERAENDSIEKARNDSIAGVNGDTNAGDDLSDDDNSNLFGKSEYSNGKEVEYFDLLRYLDEGDDIDVPQNYENFPLPQTIDFEVDLRKSPRVLRVLEIEFDFDKLTPEFRRLLLLLGNNDSKNIRNRRSVFPINE